MRVYCVHPLSCIIHGTLAADFKLYFFLFFFFPLCFVVAFSAKPLSPKVVPNHRKNGS